MRTSVFVGLCLLHMQLKLVLIFILYNFWLAQRQECKFVVICIIFLATFV